jgi:hypothetical protein
MGARRFSSYCVVILELIPLMKTTNVSETLLILTTVTLTSYPFFQALFWYGTSLGSFEIAKIILSNPKTVLRETDLRMNVLFGDVATVKLVLDHPTMNALMLRNSNGILVCSISVLTTKKKQAIESAIRFQRVEMIRVLLEDSRTEPQIESNEDTTNSFSQQTDLFSAIIKGNPEIVKLLLAHPSIDPSAKENRGHLFSSTVFFSDTFKIRSHYRCV